MQALVLAIAAQAVRFRKLFFFKSHGFTKNESQLFSELAEDEREKKASEKVRARQSLSRLRVSRTEKNNWQRGESETGPDELLKQ